MNLSKSPSITVFFPVYNDERTVRLVAEKALKILADLTDDYEVVIVNDHSPDRSGEIADQLSREYPQVRVVHHERNLGYGSAVRSGLGAAQKDWICLTDGDDEYDLEDLRRMWKLKDYYDLIITFRYVKLYSGLRIFISWVYNCLLRWLFRIHYRDISTGLRLVRRDVVRELDLHATSPFIGAEIAITCMLKGYRVGEMGIQTFPREFGRGASTSMANIMKTVKDMWATYRRVFSAHYDLPSTRHR